MIEKNVIALGDNLDIMKNIQANTIDLIYADPPFNSSKIWSLLEKNTKELRRFQDIWIGGRETFIYDFIPRVKHFYRILKETGSLVIHCDTNLSHYLKIMLDKEFGESCFRNEIVWLRTQGQFGDSYRARSRTFGKQHDCLLWYSKSPTNFKSFIKPFRLWTQDEIRKKFPENDNDGKGIYNWERQYSETGERFKEKELNNELKKTDAGYWYKRYYEQSLKGYVLSDIWIDIKPIAPGSGDKKWPTEKPEELLRVLIEKLTEENDIVLEPYMGSGVACHTAVKMNRKCFGIDISTMSFNFVRDRFKKENLTFDKTSQKFDFDEIKSYYNFEKMRNMDAFEFESIMINALGQKLGFEAYPNPKEKQRKDRKVDGFVLTQKKKLIPIQVKRSEHVGNDVVFITKEILKEHKTKEAYIIAFSFTPDAIKESRRYEIEDGLKINLITVEEIVNIVYKIDLELQENDKKFIAKAKSHNQNCEKIKFIWSIIFNKGNRNKILKNNDETGILDLNEFNLEKPYILICHAVDDCGGENSAIVEFKKEIDT